MAAESADIGLIGLAVMVRAWTYHSSCHDSTLEAQSTLSDL